jgi:hypothetical protein
MAARGGKYFGQMFHLRTGQLRLKLFPFLRQGRTLEAAVMVVRRHRDEIFLYQLTQWRVHRLLGLSLVELRSLLERVTPP